jgi:subtilase family serine protease
LYLPSSAWRNCLQVSGSDTMDAFNTEAMKLASMGVTVTVSSGDNGAAGDARYCNYDSSSATYPSGWNVSCHHAHSSEVQLLTTWVVWHFAW